MSQIPAGSYLWRTPAPPLHEQTRGTGRSRSPRNQRHFLTGQNMLGFLISHTVEPNHRPDVTCQVGGTVRVGQSDPRAPGVAPVLLPQQGPLDHHEDRRGALVDQSPGERHTGAVDDRHAEVMHAAACQRPNTGFCLLVLHFLEEAS